MDWTSSVGSENSTIGGSDDEFVDLVDLAISRVGALTALRWCRFMIATARHTWPRRNTLAQVIVTNVEVDREFEDLVNGSAGLARLAGVEHDKRRRAIVSKALERWAEMQPPTGPPS